MPQRADAPPGYGRRALLFCDAARLCFGKIFHNENAALF